MLKERGHKDENAEEEYSWNSNADKIHHVGEEWVTFYSCCVRSLMEKVRSAKLKRCTKREN